MQAKARQMKDHTAAAAAVPRGPHGRTVGLEEHVVARIRSQPCLLGVGAGHRHCQRGFVYDPPPLVGPSANGSHRQTACRRQIWRRRFKPEAPRSECARRTRAHRMGYPFRGYGAPAPRRNLFKCSRPSRAKFRNLLDPGRANPLRSRGALRQGSLGRRTRNRVSSSNHSSGKSSERVAAKHAFKRLDDWTGDF